MRSGKNQLDVYLDEPNLEMEYYEDLDVLEWWKDTQKYFPDLSIMARDLLSIPITTVASESTFDIGARVLNKYRSHLLPKNVQALICSQNWLHDFVSNGKLLNIAILFSLGLFYCHLSINFYLIIFLFWIITYR